VTPLLESCTFKYMNTGIVNFQQKS